MVAEMKLYEPTAVVAVGDDNVIDAVKAAYFKYQTGEDLLQYPGTDIYSEKNPDKKLKKIVAFPVAIGTASEVTPYAVIKDKESGIRHCISERQLLPEYSFIHSNLAMASVDQSRSGLCLALANAIEGYLNLEDPDNECGKWAKTALQVLLTNIPNLENENRDIDINEVLAGSAILGGIVSFHQKTVLSQFCRLPCRFLYWMPAIQLPAFCHTTGNSF